MKATARLATADDIAEIVRLRRVLFESLHERTSGWEQQCAAVLETALHDGSMIGAVVDAPDGSGLAAVGSAEIQQRLPGPTSLSGQLGYVSTMATDGRWRRRGFASAVLSVLLAELRARAVDRIELHATPDAEQLYRSVGFAERLGGLEMRLVDA